MILNYFEELNDQVENAFKNQRKLEDDFDLSVMYTDKYIFIDSKKIKKLLTNQSINILKEISDLLHKKESENPESISESLDELWGILDSFIK